jgi:hypothetical protein
MSKENVALFFNALSEKKDVSDVLSGATQTPEAWTDVANQKGFEFTSDELHSVLKEVLDLDNLKKDTSIEALIAALQIGAGDELSDEALAQVSGGGSFSAQLVSPALHRRFATLGYPSGFGDVATYNAPPDHIQTGHLPGFDKFVLPV